MYILFPVDIIMEISRSKSICKNAGTFFVKKNEKNHGNYFINLWQKNILTKVDMRCMITTY